MKRRLRSLRLYVLLPVLVMTLVLVVMLTVLISRIYISMSVQQESRKNAASFEAIAHELNKTVSASIADVHQIMIDPRVTAYACHQFATDAELVRARMECRDYLRAQINRDSAIYGLLFMRPDGSLFGTLPESNVFRDDRKDVALTDGVIDRILEVPLGETAWVGPLTGSELYGYESGKLPDSVMAATWKFVSVEAGECYALMLMDDAVFKDMFSLLDDGNSAIHLFTADGAEFFRQGGDSGLDAGVLISEESSGRIFKNDRNESWCVFTMPLASSGWTLAREVLMGEYEQTIRRMQTTVWAMAMSILAAGLGFYLIWLNGFMRSINALKAGIARLGRGDLTPMTGASFQTEELDSMMRELDKASVSLNEQMNTIRRMERERLELEMNDLQSIIAPHMIFNSITAIRWQASFMGAEEVSDMLIELGEMLRPMLRDRRIEWTLREELDHLSHYTHLMALRYANNFELDWQVPDELGGELVPQFTFQPLIENACQHGGHPKGALVVTVRAWEVDGWVCLTVADNGHTITPDRIAEVRGMLRTGNRGQHIGLVNVLSRLVICKGSDSTLDIDALPEDGGTVVTLRWRRVPGDDPAK